MISTAASNAVVNWPVTQSYFLTRDDPEYRQCHVRIIEFLHVPRLYRVRLESVFI